MVITRRIVIRIEATQVAWFEQHHGRSFPLGSWVEVRDPEQDGRAYSKLLQASVAELEVQSTVDQVWIHAYSEGGLDRELLFSEGAWQIVHSNGWPYEDKPAMPRWLSKKRFYSDHGDSVFEALLGRDIVWAGVSRVTVS
jgi:hypothetical protein